MMLTSPLAAETPAVTLPALFPTLASVTLLLTKARPVMHRIELSDPQNDASHAEPPTLAIPVKPTSPKLSPTRVKLIVPVPPALPPLTMLTRPSPAVCPMVMLPVTWPIDILKLRLLSDPAPALLTKHVSDTHQET